MLKIVFLSWCFFPSPFIDLKPNCCSKKGGKSPIQVYLGSIWHFFFEFRSQISDDDRMSLTTAQSDEDEIESSHNSPYKAKQSGSAASFNCTGAVRKAGFLSVKKWILRKKHQVSLQCSLNPSCNGIYIVFLSSAIQVELARKRGWKGYWVCLKGTTLLFYPCDSREGRSVEATPKHLIIVDGAIMQAIPEHPKRDYIFCLSTAFGDAYLFQVKGPFILCPHPCNGSHDIHRPTNQRSC